MSNTMAAHEPIKYLDSILNEEEKRCEYGHQWRNFTISRSGRFKSKNKKRDIVDGQLFNATAVAKDENSYNKGTNYKEQDKLTSWQSASMGKSLQQQSSATNSRTRERVETYKSYYETNL